MNAHRSRRLGGRGLVVVLLGAGVAGLGACASSPLVREAESGDRAHLRADIAASEAAGHMTNAEAARLGRVVAERELEQAKGDDAGRRLDDIEACAGDLDGLLADRAKTRDEVGAEAAMLRLEDGRLSEASARKNADDTVDGWRAVGVRGLVGKHDGDARRAAMRDGSTAVRRAAMRAAGRSADEADEALLADAARVDPDPLVRGLAVRAIGALPPQKTAGIARVDRLRDLWTGGDDALREDVAAAYTMPGVYGYGGEAALAVVLAEGQGPGAIAGAGAVLRAKKMSDASRAAAKALVLRMLASGSLRDRAHALAVSPSWGSDAQVDDAVRALAKDDDVRVRLAALTRLSAAQVEHDARTPDANAELRKLATSDDAVVAMRARAALARAGDRSVQGALERDLSSPRAGTRLAAADALADLGMAGRAAPLLADDDVEVRTRAACTMIRGAD